MESPNERGKEGYRMESSISQKEKTITVDELMDHSLRLLETDTKLMFHSDDIWGKAQHSKSRDADFVEAAWANNIYAESDAFILYAVRILNYANDEMLYKMLQILSKKYPKKMIPKDKKALSTRIINLSLNNLLYGKYVEMDDNKKIHLYTCSQHGYSLLFRQLNKFTHMSERYSFFDPEFEIMRLVATNYIALCIASSPYFKDYIGPKQNTKVFDKTYLRGRIFSQICLVRENIKYRIILEPLYFQVDERRDTLEERIENTIGRLRFIEKVAQEYRKNGETVKIVFCIENKRGLQKAAGLVHKYIPLMLEQSLFTSESLLYKNKGKLALSFLEVVVSENEALGVRPYLDREFF